MPICKLRLRTIEVTTTRLLQSVLSSNSSLLSSLRTIEATTTNRAAHRHRIPQPPRPAATAATDLTTAATTTAASCHRIPQPPRFSVRSMAHSASPFNKITIQRDNTSGASITWDIVVGGWDLEYSAEFVPNEEGSYTIAVERARKVEASEEAIHNTFTSKESGKLVLSVDKSASRKKKVAAYRYFVQLNN